MPGFQPLIVDNGQIESVSGRRTNISKLNIGPIEYIEVISDSFTIISSLVFANSESLIDIYNIYGGEEGDLLFLLGNKIKLFSGIGNLDMASGQYVLQPGKKITLLFLDGGWTELGRRT